jgi:predicted ATPase
LIEQAQELGEAPEDPLLLFSVLYAFWAASAVAFNGDAVWENATQFLALAEKQATAAPILQAHRVMGIASLYTGSIAKALTHLERAVALYDPVEHRSMAMRFGQDTRVHALLYRSWAGWLLGYPDAALVDAKRALSDAREIGEVTTLMTALAITFVIDIFLGDYATANTKADELIPLADEKRAPFWKAGTIAHRGCVLALTGKASDAIQVITSGVTALRETGATLYKPTHLSYLAAAHAGLGQFDDAWRCIDDAIRAVDSTKERWFEAEVHRIAGEISLQLPEPDRAIAQTYFQNALTISRQQQAKSWELRAAMSMARLWRDQGKREEARDLLAPVYGWFTEGFDTLDLKEAKALLEELSS